MGLLPQSRAEMAARVTGTTMSFSPCATHWRADLASAQIRAKLVVHSRTGTNQ